MIRSALIGLAAGARAMTPLAAISDAAKTGALPATTGLRPGWAIRSWPPRPSC